MIQHHINLQAARFTGADFSCRLPFFAFIPSSPFAPLSPITHSPSQFSLSVLTPSPSSLHHCLLPPAVQLHISVLPHHLALFPQPPSSACFKMETLSLHFWGFRKPLSLPLLHPACAPFLFSCSSVSFPEAWEGNESLVLWGVTGSPIPLSEPPINQRPNIQLATGACWNVPSPLPHSFIYGLPEVMERSAGYEGSRG